MIFEYYSTKAEICNLRCGDCNAVEVAYSGMVVDESFCSLRPIVLAATKAAAALVIRLDRSILMMTDKLIAPDAAYMTDMPSGAYVVKPEQFDVVMNYSRKLARVGVMRAVFLNSQQALAHQWAEFHVRSRRAR